MRNFRTAAVAAATAVAVSFTGITAASAQDDQQHENNESSFVEGSSVLSSEDAQSHLSSETTEESPNLSSKIGDLMNADKNTSGSDLFGEEQGPEGEGDITNPGWARLWRDGNIVAAIGTVVGGIIAAYNYGVYNGFFPHFIQK